MIPEGPVVDGPIVDGWVDHPRDTILRIVVDWFVLGLWQAVKKIAGWILAIYREAVEQPLVAAGSSVMDAFRPVGAFVIELVGDLTNPLRQLAESGPLGFILVAFTTGVFLVVLSYLARAAWEFTKGVNPY